MVEQSFRAKAYLNPISTNGAYNPTAGDRTHAALADGWHPALCHSSAARESSSSTASWFLPHLALCSLHQLLASLPVPHRRSARQHICRSSTNPGSWTMPLGNRAAWWLTGDSMDGSDQCSLPSGALTGCASCPVMSARAVAARRFQAQRSPTQIMHGERKTWDSNPRCLPKR